MVSVPLDCSSGLYMSPDNNNHSIAPVGKAITPIRGAHTRHTRKKFTLRAHGSKGRSASSTSESVSAVGLARTGTGIGTALALAHKSGSQCTAQQRQAQPRARHLSGCSTQPHHTALALGVDVEPRRVESHGRRCNAAMRCAGCAHAFAERAARTAREERTSESALDLLRDSSRSLLSASRGCGCSRKIAPVLIM